MFAKVTWFALGNLKGQYWKVFAFQLSLGLEVNLTAAVMLWELVQQIVVSWAVEDRPPSILRLWRLLVP
jgi:hypothetical protein